MISKLKWMAVSLVLTICTPAMAETRMPFEFTAAYNYGPSMVQNTAVTYTRVGEIVGSWQWRFANGYKGNTHFTAFAFYRSYPENILIGTIVFNMFELVGEGEDELYMTYEAISRDEAGASVEIEAEIIGGTGKYSGATGNVHWIAVNGFIEKGTGELILP